MQRQFSSVSMIASIRCWKRTLHTQARKTAMLRTEGCTPKWLTVNIMSLLLRNCNPSIIARVIYKQTHYTARLLYTPRPLHTYTLTEELNETPILCTHSHTMSMPYTLFTADCADIIMSTLHLNTTHYNFTCTSSHYMAWLLHVTPQPSHCTHTHVWRKIFK